MKINQTLEKFQYPDSLIYEYDFWVVLLRPEQITLASSVIAAKVDAETNSFGNLSAEAGRELPVVIQAF